MSDRPEAKPDEVEIASEDSFPASDPPAWTGERPAAPDREDEAEREPRKP